MTDRLVRHAEILGPEADNYRLRDKDLARRMFNRLRGSVSIGPDSVALPWTGGLGIAADDKRPALSLSETARANHSAREAYPYLPQMSAGGSGKSTWSTVCVSITTPFAICAFHQGM